MELRILTVINVETGDIVYLGVNLDIAPSDSLYEEASNLLEVDSIVDNEYFTVEEHYKNI